jgi:hypothetical protein
MHLCTLTLLLLLLLLLQEGKLDDLSKMIDILQEAGFHKTQFFKDQVRAWPGATAASYMLSTSEALHARTSLPHMRLMLSAYNACQLWCSLLMLSLFKLPAVQHHLCV